MYSGFPPPKEQIKRDGRLTIIFMVLFFIMCHGQVVNKTTFKLNFMYLHYTSDKLLHLDSSEKTPFIAEHLPLGHYPFFFLRPPINRADKSLLMTIKGIGPGLAEDIVRFRQKAGTISNIEELQQIPGIGEKRAASLINELTFDEKE